MANPIVPNLDGSNPGPAGISTVNTQLLYSTGQTLQTIYVTMTPAAVATVSTAEQSFGLNGATFVTATTAIKPNDVIVAVIPPSAQLVAASGFRVDGTTADKFYISFTNPTAGSLTPPSGVWAITVLRPTTFNAAAQGSSVLG